MDSNTMAAAAANPMITPESLRPLLLLKKKKILFIGAQGTSLSLSYIVTACDAGASHVYVAIEPRHESELRFLIKVMAMRYINRIHLLPVKDLEQKSNLTSPSPTEIAADIVSKVLQLSNDYRPLPIFNIDACITFHDSFLELTADLCSIFRLPGNDPAGVRITVDKYLFRSFLQEHGFGRALYSSIFDFFNGNAPTELQFPLMIKPTEGVGSRGVFLVESKEEMLVKMALPYFDNLILTADQWMIEEYLEGPELGVQLVMSNGECIFASVMEATKTPLPLFQGTGRFYPTSLGRQCDEEVVNECVRAAKALGLNHSVVDIDCKFVPGRGPVLIEINARKGGHSVAFMHEEIFGVDLVLEHLRCGCGEIRDHCSGQESRKFGSKSPMAEPPEDSKTWYTRIVLSDRSGFLTSLTNRTFQRDLYNAMPTYLRSSLTLARLGFREAGSLINSDVLPVILAFVLAVGSSREEAYDKAERLRDFASTFVNGHIVQKQEEETPIDTYLQIVGTCISRVLAGTDEYNDTSMRAPNVLEDNVPIPSVAVGDSIS